MGRRVPTGRSWEEAVASGAIVSCQIGKKYILLDSMSCRSRNGESPGSNVQHALIEKTTARE